MDPALVPWALAVSVLTVVGTVVVGVYTARSARAANRESSQLGGWRDLVATLQEDVKRLRAERAEDERHAQEEIRGCNQRITSLAATVDALERRERALILWARRVIQVVSTADVVIPAPPIDITQTDPGERRAVR